MRGGFVEIIRAVKGDGRYSSSPVYPLLHHMVQIGAPVLGCRAVRNGIFFSIEARPSDFASALDISFWIYRCSLQLDR